MKTGIMNLKKVIAVSMCALLFALSTGCSGVDVAELDTSALFSDPVTQVIAAINSSEYSTAREIYYDEISGNLELEKDVEDQLSEMISSAIESYNNGESTYDEAELVLETIERAEIYSSSALESSYDELENLKTSKNHYDEAAALEEDGEYLKAYEEYAQVSTEDANYESAQTKREEVLEALLVKLISDAEELIESGDYETAWINLFSYSDIFGEVEEFLEELNRIYSSCMDALIADVEALIGESAYSEAYDALLNEYTYFNFEDDDLYQAEVNKVYSLWVSAVLDEAEVAFGISKDYAAAILVLQHSGLTDDAIDSAIAKYQEYIPISLTSLSYTRKGNCIWVNLGSAYSSYCTDVSNNTYDPTTVICPSSRDSSGDSTYVVYYLNAEYSTLTGTLYRPYCTLQFDVDWTSNVQIYGDGVLLYETSDITSNTYDPLDFEIDVTGVRELKIVMSGTLREAVSGWIGLYDDYPRVCAANFMLSK